MTDRTDNKKRLGGVSAILVTGGIALAELAPDAERAIDYVLLAIIAVATAVGAWLLNRFIARHGHEIGEARFDTRNDR